VFEAGVDRPARSAAFVGLLFAGALLLGGPARLDDRVVYLADAPRAGWYEADDLAAAARASGAEPASLASAPIADGDTVRLDAGWALPIRALPGSPTRVFGGRISLNSATQAELESLPHVGPTLAARIIAGRPYRTAADVNRVKGIGPATFAAIAPSIGP
jgi:competence protein ComEA